jgi:hypothetical protein
MSIHTPSQPAMATGHAESVNKGRTNRRRASEAWLRKTGDHPALATQPAGLSATIHRQPVDPGLFYPAQWPGSRRVIRALGC